MNKQEALDALELYHRNMEHILGPEDEKVKTIETCIKLIEEIEDELPSAQPERIIYANMSDEEFEKWLYEHGICNPNIHESIPCDVVPLLIDNAISELPPTQPERLTDDDFETIRIHLSAFKEGLCNQRRWNEAKDYQRLIDRFMSFASAQTENLQPTCN